MQVRDLLIHNSGLPQGGGDLMLWPEPNHYTRADIIAGLAHIKPAYSFRSGYAYDNLLYVVAGEVAAAAGGASYEELVRREIFEPLGLSRCRVGAFDRGAVGNVAQPHAYRDGRAVVTNADGAQVPAITSAAAGGIRCSLGDMLQWARNWLLPDARRPAWLSQEQRREMWLPRTPMPISARRRAWDNTHAYAYGYGFRMADVDGIWTVSHTGTLSGMYSVMTLLPDRRSGFVVLMNGDGDEARTVLNEVLVKHFTAPGQGGTVAEYAARIAAEPVSASRLVPADTSSRVPATTKELADRLGNWRDPWFGAVTLCERDGAVRFSAVKSPELRGRVVRVGQRYLIDWDSDDLEAWLDFTGNDGAAVMSLAKTDPAGDFSYDYEDLAFRREGDCMSTEVSTATTPAEADLIDVATLVPDIALDIRYAGSDNFVGVPIDGYNAPKCYLRTAAAQALQRVEAGLRKDGLRLQLFDCYRPVRAVRHFVRWAGDLDDQRTKPRFYPDLDKRVLLGDYIAPVSGHSRGATVDLGLLQCEGDRCTPLDMGTAFDFFDQRAHTDAPGISAAQHANRERLKAAMLAQGFKNYPHEWWHYTLAPLPVPSLLHDVPVE
jgi:D-alanyl-D-alanine dipeptidase/CubicO group peptidase (beta-lactamase class C family)